MSTIGQLVLFTLIAVGGVLLAVSGIAQSVPRLDRVVARLQRTGQVPGESVTGVLSGPHFDKVFSSLGENLITRGVLFPTRHQLSLVNRSSARHAGLLVAGALLGIFIPPLLVALLQLIGLLSLGVFIPLVGSLSGGALGVFIVHVVTVGEAAEVEANLRFQVSSYLDVVTMLLAGNAGYEGAMQQAASAGDGRLFRELRRRMRESGTRGASLTGAIASAGNDLGVRELGEIASTAALSAAEGSPVAKTLAAKCATMRSTLATEQETEARLRTSRLTTPIVGMALIFMALVIYPALEFAR